MSEPDFTIQRASGDHSAEAANVVRAVFDEYRLTWDAANYCADLYDLEKFYLREEHDFWIAWRQGRAIGTVGLKTFKLVPGSMGEIVKQDGVLRAAGCDASLERLYVLAGVRRHGIGTALFETVLRAARDRGCRALEIWSDKRFVEAHKLYSRYGARAAGERICRDPDASPEWGLMLRLT